MRLNRRNQVVMGVDGTLSIEGVVPAPLVGVNASGGGWLTDDQPLYQRCDAEGCRLELLDTVTMQTRLFDSAGANVVVCGAGVAAAWLAGVGYRDSLGRTSRSWYPLDVDDITADVAICLDYDHGSGLAILGHDGSLTTIAVGLLDRLEACLRDGALTFRQGGALRVWYRSGAAMSVSAIPGMLGARSSMGWTLGWLDAIGMCLYRPGTTRVLPISADGHDFNPDLRVLESGLISVASSAGAGERPNELRRYLVDPVAATVNGQPRAWVDALHPPAVVPDFAASPRPIGVLVAGEPGAVPSFTEAPGPTDATAVGVFVDLDHGDVPASRALAEAAGLPLVAYVDGSAAYPPARVPAAAVPVIPMVCAYPWHGETAAAAVSRTRLTVVGLQAGGFTPGLCIAAYRQINGDGEYNLGEQQVLDVMAGCWALAIERGLPFVWLFAQHRGPSDGIDAFPSFQRALAAMRIASPDWRAFPAVPRPPIPAPPTPKPAPSPTPVPAPTPAPQKDRPMLKTDSMSYTDARDGLSPRAAGRGYTDGVLDCYRLMAEGTPLATVLAGDSAPTQTPWPNIAYVQVAAMALAIEAARRQMGKGVGYQDGVIDTWRIFGAERWPVAYVLADIAGGPLPDRPFVDPF